MLADHRELLRTKTFEKSSLFDTQIDAFQIKMQKRLFYNRLFALASILMIVIIALMPLVHKFDDIIKAFMPFYYAGMAPHLAFAVFSLILMLRNFRTQLSHPFSYCVFYTHILINIALFFGQIVSVYWIAVERSKCTRPSCFEYHRDILLQFFLVSGLIDLVLVAQPIAFNRYTTKLTRK